jgi:4-alpha-glucanotransferase
MHEYAPEETFPRSAGLLLHPTSLPGPHGVGDLGEGAFRLLQFMARAGISWWQILPLVPPGSGFSPYSTSASMAGNPMLISLDILARAGLLDEGDLRVEEPFPLDTVDWPRVKAFKMPRVQKAAQALLRHEGHGWRPGFKRFVEENSWAVDYALYSALKEHHQLRPWWEWPEGERDRQPAALAAARERAGSRVDELLVEQFFFDMQWKMLQVQCKDLTIRTIGDVPIYVDHDSVDVWVHRSAFQLNAQGMPTKVSGVPPDPFSATGQLWGNPLYDWEQLARDGYGFWVERMRRALSLTDVVRIDHFRGFAAYWEVEYGADTAMNGRWVEGPGTRLFDALRKELGDALPLIAEDLGIIDQPVRDLLEAIDAPGMKILQFAFGEDALHPYLPHNVIENSVVYPGTHDTDTIVGWWNSADERVKDHVRRYFAFDGSNIHQVILRAALMSRAHTAVFAMQDLLGLDSGARMNIPGLAEGNWGWRVRGDAFNEGLADNLGDMIRMYDRDELKRLNLLAIKAQQEAAQAR